MAVDACGDKHRKLSCWILGTVIVLMAAIITIQVAVGGQYETNQNNHIESLDTRLRMEEQTSAELNGRLEATLRSIDNRLERIERQMESLP
jgi:uncharacterized protein HemX